MRLLLAVPLKAGEFDGSGQVRGPGEGGFYSLGRAGRVPGPGADAFAELGGRAFNPFAWQVRRELDVARELACDEGVAELSSARRAYARTLDDVAGFSAGLSHALPAASMSLSDGRSLVLRVTRTLALAKRKPARAVVIAACALGLAGAPIALAQVMLATPAPPTPPTPARPVTPKAPVVLEGRQPLAPADYSTLIRLIRS